MSNDYALAKKLNGIRTEVEDLAVEGFLTADEFAAILDILIAADDRDAAAKKAALLEGAK